MAAGEFEKAVQIFDQLLAERKVAFLRTAALPEISDFVAIVPENVAAVAFYKDLLSRVEMLAGSYNLTKGEYVNQENKDDSSKYSPVYCRLYAIHGLEKEKARAEKLLSREPERRKTLVLWRVDGDWLYGHCNFKYQPEDGYNLKFLDKLETVLNRDLEIFAAAGLNRILFVEQELMDKFSANRDFDFDSFSLDYDLVKDDDPDWAAAG
jgi:hypothetical protein